MFLRSGFAALLFCLAATFAHADSITFDAGTSSGGTYNYNYVSNGTVFTGAGFTFTGLSGVTGASTTVPTFFTVSFTSTSVTFGTANNSSAAAGTFRDIFTINSSVLTQGNVQYSIPSNPAQSGTVLGPVAAAVAVTPEPSSLLLLSTGALGVLGMARKRFA